MEGECRDCHVLTERVSQLEKRLDEKFESERLIRDKLETAMNVRLGGMNEFREQLTRQAATFVSRTELLAVATLVAVVVGAIFSAYGKVGK